MTQARPQLDLGLVSADSASACEFTARKWPDLTPALPFFSPSPPELALHALENLVLTGVSPHNAQSIVKLDVDLDRITTKSSLMAGLKWALDKINA